MTKIPDCRGYRFPTEITARAVWLYHRFTLSSRDVEVLVAERGIEPLLDQTFRLSAAAHAYQRMYACEQMGKLVLLNQEHQA